MTGELAIAVHAIVYLNHMQQTLSSETLAENVCTNPARVRKIMSRLKRAGLIETKEGADGGYRFKMDPASITLLEVLEALGTPLISVSWKSGDPHKDCMIASGMAGVMDGIYTELDGCCRKQLAKITILDIDRRLGRQGLKSKSL